MYVVFSTNERQDWALPALLLEYNVVKVAVQNFMAQHTHQHDTPMHEAEALFDNKALKSAREFRLHLTKRFSRNHVA